MLHVGPSCCWRQLHTCLLCCLLCAAFVSPLLVAAVVLQAAFLVVCQGQAPAFAVWVQAVAWPVEAPMHEHT
jgi:hypothetical protein